SINNVGNVVYSARLDSGENGLFVGNGIDPPVLIADASGIFDQFQFAYLNDQGQVAFNTRLDGGRLGTFLWDRGIITALGSPSDVFIGPMSLNNSGAVAFRRHLEDGTSGIFVAENGTMRPYVDDSGPFINFGIVDGPSINDAGQVAFFGGLSTG